MQCNHTLNHTADKRTISYTHHTTSNAWKAACERFLVAAYVFLYVVAFGEASCHGSEVNVAPVSHAQDIGERRPEWLWPLWLHKIILIVIIGFCNR